MAEQIPPFEGANVARSTLRLTKAGDGLSEALTLDPQAFHIGDELCFVVRGEVKQVAHKPGKIDSLARQHTVEVTGIAPIDAATADQVISAEAERVARLRDERDGQTRIEDAEPPQE